MPTDAGPIDELVAQLARLPGIGEKTATRLAYHILKQPEDLTRALTDAITGVKARISFCEVCFNLTDVQPCRICQNAGRDASVLCVVQQPPDLTAFEKTGAFRGLYHVLHGALAPLDDVGPEDLHIAELVERAKNGVVKEIIIATNPNREGEATAHYLAEVLAPMPVKVTRIAHGVPAGSEVEYADAVTLGLALKGRTDF